MPDQFEILKEQVSANINTKLILSREVLTSTQIIDLLKLVPLKGSKLEHINLAGCLLGDKGAAVLVSVIARCPQLKSINLYYNGISDVWAVALLSVLQTCRNLEFVDLSSNRIGVAGAEALVSTAKQCLSLQELIAGDNTGVIRLQIQSNFNEVIKGIINANPAKRAVLLFTAGALSRDTPKGTPAKTLVRNDGDGAIMRRVLGMLM